MTPSHYMLRLRNLGYTLDLAACERDRVIAAERLANAVKACDESKVRAEEAAKVMVGRVGRRRAGR